ncbi:hypothetical protein GGI15_004187 [Coemansia interrupta]|uniref:Uncharacterized protein n=1 Tax=Coemansia interrupta TaxID=1126814 RepID=A0A9W8LEK1_9FUNG|nr:hypothetical protein GGI15_004187 [Coemansia interrupta]
MFGVALVFASLSNIFANMWLKHWASSNTDLVARHGVFYYLLIYIYGALGLLGASMSSLQSLLLWTRCSIQASTKVHCNMLVGVLRLPASFFDVARLGRILNYFSSDLQWCDETHPRSVSRMVNTMQPQFIAKNEDHLEKNIRAYYMYLPLCLETLDNKFMLGTTLLAIFTLQYLGYGDAGLVGLSVAYALDFTGSLNWSVHSYTEVENSMTQLELVVEYARLPSEAPEVIEDRRPAGSWPEQGMVEFKGYSTRYREGLDLVLKDLSFRVEPRQKVRIVGRTGAGKSLLTLALFRIIEAAGGKVLIDGEDIAQYGLYDVRSKLSIIPQDPVLFAGTVRENLDPFGTYADHEIWQALEHAHLADVVRSKEEGLEFVVTQGGENFSVGQRQLICLARALLKRAKVLVLDEATAAIDNSTDAIIQESIRKEFKDCTVLTIAHRLNTIIDSDMILVVDGGKLAEYDTPENLLANEASLFAKLVEEARNSDAQ